MRPLTENDPIAAEMLEVWSVMEGETDRGCVLAGAALIEWQMGNLLKATFLALHGDGAASIEPQVDVMLSPLNEKSILGAAAPRARMCRLLGLIPQDIYDALKYFLVFRNKHFAHARRNVQLADPKIRKDLDHLVALIPERHRVVIGKCVENDDRGRFIGIVVVLYLFLEHVQRQDHTGSQPSSS